MSEKLVPVRLGRTQVWRSPNGWVRVEERRDGSDRRVLVTPPLFVVDGGRVREVRTNG